MNVITIATTIGLPTLFTGLLMQVFQALKIFVLAPYVPGFRPNDANSNAHLRILFYLLVLGTLIFYVFSGMAGLALPTDIAGYILLVNALINSAGILTGTAMGVYSVSMSKGNGVSAPSDSGSVASDGAGSVALSPTPIPFGTGAVMTVPLSAPPEAVSSTTQVVGDGHNG